MIPGTLHRATKIISKQENDPIGLFIRLGRHLPDVECRHVAADICTRLSGKSYTNVLVLGSFGSGQTTLLRQIAESLSGVFHKRAVGVIDAVSQHDSRAV